MKIKTKKQNEDGLVRLETSGEIKEVIINEDFLNPSNVSVALCFKGKNSSGIVELTPKEIEMLSKEVTDNISMLKDIKVMKFEK